MKSDRYQFGIAGGLSAALAISFTNDFYVSMIERLGVSEFVADNLILAVGIFLLYIPIYSGLRRIEDSEPEGLSPLWVVLIAVLVYIIVSFARVNTQGWFGPFLHGGIILIVFFATLLAFKKIKSI